jgi:hypothetical protein
MGNTRLSRSGVSETAMRSDMVGIVEQAITQAQRRTNPVMLGVKRGVVSVNEPYI